MLNNIDRNIIDYYAGRLLTKRDTAMDGEILAIVNDFRKTIMHQPFKEILNKTVDKSTSDKIRYEIIYEDTSHMSIPNFDDCLIYLFDEATLMSEIENEKNEEKSRTISAKVSSWKDFLKMKFKISLPKKMLTKK